MEKKLFFVGIALLIYSLLLKVFVKKNKYDNRVTMVFHGIFYCAAGIVIGLLGQVLLGMFGFISISETELNSRIGLYFGIIGGVIGVIAGVIGILNKPEKEREKLLRKDLDWSDTGWSAVLLASLLMYFVVQAFKIPSGSMRMTLVEGDHLFVNKFIYGIHVPLTDGKRILSIKKVQRQDIIIFLCPKIALSQDEQRRGVEKDFIKRAIGLPGDTVEIRGKKVYVNNKLLEEPYLNFEDEYIQPRIKLFNTNQEYQKVWSAGGFRSLPARDNFGPITVPPGHFFVMGDNRDKSFDSRFWGPLPDRNLKGNALILYWPINRIKIIK